MCDAGNERPTAVSKLALAQILHTILTLGMATVCTFKHILTTCNMGGREVADVIS